MVITMTNNAITRYNNTAGRIEIVAEYLGTSHEVYLQLLTNNGPEAAYKELGETVRALANLLMGIHIEMASDYRDLEEDEEEEDDDDC